MAEKVFVHIGAHRTGSSSFQAFLGHNRELLKNAGYNLFYPNRDGAEGGYSKRISLPNPSVAAVKHTNLFKKHVRPMRRKFAILTDAPRPFSILSEENILGRMRLLFLGKFYPQAGLRLDLVRRGLEQPIDNVALVVRDYGDFYTSAAAMQALFAKRPAFETVLPRLMDNTKGWTDLAERLLQRGQVRNLTVVDYPARGDDSTLFGHLCGSAPKGLSAPPKRTNISASHKAIDEIQRRHGQQEKLPLDERAEIIERYAVRKGYAPYDPFTRQQRAALSQRYQKDLEALSKMPDLKLVTRTKE